MDAVVVKSNPSSLTIMMERRRTDTCVSSAHLNNIDLAVCSETPPDSTPSEAPGEGSRVGHSKPSINLQLGVLYYTIFLLGFQDGTLGPLIPVIQRIYHVSFVL